MKKATKALIKHEWKSTMYMIFYFMIIALIAIYGAAVSYRECYTEYIRIGASRAMQFMEIPFIHLKLVLIFFCIGIIVLVVMSFKDLVHTETSRFLKSLPSSQNQYKVKVIVGLSMYTIPYLMIAIGYLVYWMKYREFFKDMQSLQLVHEAFNATDHIGYLLFVLILYYLIITAVYMFLVWMQYMWHNRIGAAIVGILIWNAPLFIHEAIYGIYGGISRILEDYKLLNPLLYGWQERVFLAPSIDGYFEPENVVDIVQYPTLKLCILAVIITMCIVGIIYMNKRYYIEEAHQLIPSKTFRIIFIVGVGICSYLVGGIILDNSYFLRYYYFDLIQLQIPMVMIGLVGVVIAYKISQIGRGKEKEGRR